MLSFRVPETTSDHRYDNVQSRQVLESDVGTGLTATSIGLTYPSLDSDTTTTQDMFTDTTNSKA
jgi:hypothetical protein